MTPAEAEPLPIVRIAPVTPEAHRLWSTTLDRRPTLLGAILIKARVVAKRRREKFHSDRQDLIRLLGYDPRALAHEEQLKSSEKKWLRNVGAALNFQDPALAAAFPPETLERAQQAFRLLGSPQSDAGA